MRKISLFLITIVLFKQKVCLTQRAPDWWESARFQAVFSAQSWFRQIGFTPSHPPAGNAYRWAAGINALVGQKATVKNLNSELILPYALVAVFGILGVYVAFQTYDLYPVVVRGVVGIAVLYFSFRYYLPPRKKDGQHVDLKIVFPGGFKYLVFGFALSIVLFWAGAQAVDMFYWLVGLITER